MKPINAPDRERGVALATVLILLLVMTLLGLAAMRGTVLEERMTSGQMDRSMAFQAAEAALREGESLAAGKPVLPAAGCSNGVCTPPDPDVESDTKRWLAAGFWADGSKTWREATVKIGNFTAKPRYIVELMAANVPPSGSCTTSVDVSPDAECSGTESRYRVTARAVGNGGAEVILQSIYAVP